MPALPLNITWALALLGALTWTIGFSLTQPQLRGYRNVGLLATYAIGLAMAARLPWREAAATWFTFGLVGGLAYVAYELWARRGESSGSSPARVTTLLHGLLAWPIMVPEAIEYLLADAGVLTAAPIESPAAVLDAEHDAASQQG